MSLPTPARPKYKMNLHSNGKEITYMPYTVGEEKILFMAIETTNDDKLSDEEKQKILLDAVIQILENCIDISVDELTKTDIEMIFLKLRGVSISQDLDIKYRINDCDKEECPKELNVRVNIEDAYVNSEEEKFFEMGFTKKGDVWLLPLGDDVGIALKQKFIIEGDDESILYKCTEYIYDKEQVYTDFSYEDFSEFLTSVPKKEAEKIRKLFTEQENIQCDINGKCKTCGKEFNTKLIGLKDFFF